MVLPIPYEATTSFGGGTSRGPRAIITASQQVELYDEELGREAWSAGVATLDPIEVDASGPAPMHRRILEAARPIVTAGKTLVGLGGEHSISSALVQAVHERRPALSVLQVDAHADLRNTYQESPYSHACVMRRVHDLGVPAVGVGIRNLSREEAEFAESHELPLYPASRCRRGDEWIAEAVERLSPEVYVTIDIDGFDPAYAPGTGTPEPGGLDWYQVTDLLARVVASGRRVVGFDVVEVTPQAGAAVTEFLAAKLAYRLIGG